MKKIAFVVTSCTGKTSLLNRLRLKYQTNNQIIFIDEAFRKYFTQNPNIKKRFVGDVQKEVLRLTLSQEKKAHDSKVEFIFCDGSVIDPIVYIKLQGFEKEYQGLFEVIKSWIKLYDSIFLLDPTNVPFQNDEIRKESEMERLLIHGAFLDFFKEKKILYELLSGSLEKRLERIEKAAGFIPR